MGAVLRCEDARGKPRRYACAGNMLFAAYFFTVHCVPLG